MIYNFNFINNLYGYVLQTISGWFKKNQKLTLFQKCWSKGASLVAQLDTKVIEYEKLNYYRCKIITPDIYYRVKYSIFVPLTSNKLYFPHIIFNFLKNYFIDKNTKELLFINYFFAPSNIITFFIIFIGVCKIVKNLIIFFQNKNFKAFTDISTLDLISFYYLTQVILLSIKLLGYGVYNRTSFIYLCTKIIPATSNLEGVELSKYTVCCYLSSTLGVVINQILKQIILYLVRYFFTYFYTYLFKKIYLKYKKSFYTIFLITIATFLLDEFYEILKNETPNLDFKRKIIAMVYFSIFAIFRMIINKSYNITFLLYGSISNYICEVAYFLLNEVVIFTEMLVLNFLAILLYFIFKKLRTSTKAIKK